MSKDKKYSDDYYLVNRILAEWNPVGVPGGIAESEYTMYVPNMLKFHNDYDGLAAEMKRIVNDVTGLTFDDCDDDFKNDTLLFAKKIIQVLNDNRLISYTELFLAAESDTSNSSMKINADLFLSAMTDYPTPYFEELIDFLNELKNEIGFPLTFELISNYKKKLYVNIAHNGWKLQALYSLLEMFNSDKTKTLDELVKEISDHYKSKVADEKTG